MGTFFRVDSVIYGFFPHNTNIYAKQYRGKRKTGSNIRKKQKIETSVARPN